MRDMLKDEITGLLFRKWGVSSCERVLLLVHGMGAHAGRWEPLAASMASNGTASYALELEGFGETRGLRGHVDSFRVYYRHIKRLRKIVLEENSARQVFLAGESLGALISFMLCAREEGLFNGLICLSPAFRSTMKFTLMTYLGIFISALVTPKKQFPMPFDSAMCTHDENMRREMEDDPREHRWATARLLSETARAQLLSPGMAHRIKIPVLFLLAGADTMTSVARAQSIFARLRNDDSSIKTYPGMSHALSIETGREKVFSDMRDWMNGIGTAGG